MREVRERTLGFLYPANHLQKFTLGVKMGNLGMPGGGKVFDIGGEWRLWPGMGGGCGGGEIGGWVKWGARPIAPQARRLKKSGVCDSAADRKSAPRLDCLRP